MCAADLSVRVRVTDRRTDDGGGGGTERKKGLCNVLLIVYLI